MEETHRPRYGQWRLHVELGASVASLGTLPSQHIIAFTSLEAPSLSIFVKQSHSQLPM